MVNDPPPKDAPSSHWMLNRYAAPSVPSRSMTTSSPSISERLVKSPDAIVRSVTSTAPVSNRVRVTRTVAEPLSG